MLAMDEQMVLVHVWIWVRHCLQHHIDVDWMHGTVYILLALDEKRVRWYYCMFKLTVPLIVWYTMHYDTMQLNSPATQLQRQWWYTDAHRMMLMLILIEYNTGMGRYHVGFGRTGCTLILLQVSIWIWHCLTEEFLRCTITPSQLHTRVLFNYNGNDIRLCADVDIDWI